MTGKQVFWCFTAFFGFIAAVNGVMMTFAISTHSGVVTEHAYEKGLAYNNVVQAEAKQEALGWIGTIDYQDGRLLFSLKDSENTSITPDKVIATITRPAERGMDFVLELNSEHDPNIFPARGVWDVRVNAIVGNNNFQQRKRIVVE